MVWQVTPEREVWFSGDGKSRRLVRAAAVILATGAMERPVPVPGWTLPGVMTAGRAADHAEVERRLWPAGPFVVAGSGPLLYLLVQQCLAAGAASGGGTGHHGAGANEWRALRHLPEAVADAQAGATWPRD